MDMTFVSCKFYKSTSLCYLFIITTYQFTIYTKQFTLPYYNIFYKIYGGCMNKKINTFLFFLGTTIANVIIILILTILGFIVLSLVLPKNTHPTIGQILFILVFLGSIAASFFIHHKLIKYISNRVKMDKYFYPFLRPRKKK